MKECRRQRIRLSIGNLVTGVETGRIITADGSAIDASLILWTAGIEPNRIVLAPEAQADLSGCMFTDRYLQIEPGTVFAAGDAVAYAEYNVTIPKNAQTAMLMATVIAKNVSRALHGLPPRPFRYASKGNLLMTGETGFVDLRFLTLKTRLAPMIRDLFYRYRQRQIAR